MGRYKNPDTPKAGKKLKILFLGGTRFIGPPAVQYAIERGHDITLFNRGLSNPHIFKKVKKIKGDRLGPVSQLDRLLSTRWDVVVDTWQGNPLAVDESARLLKDKTEQYIYVSSISVYGRDNYKKPVITEENPVPALPAMPGDKATELPYRQCKQLAEAALLGHIPDKHTVVRSHVIVGYYMEPQSEGQMYWPVRFRKGGDILCPGDGQDNTQLVDVRDAARWLIHCAENKNKGIYNIGRRYKWAEYAGGCRSLSDKDCTLHWVTAEEQQNAGIRENTDLPIYVARTNGPGFFNHDDKKAMLAGMHYRPLADTLQQVIDGFNRHYPPGFSFGPACNCGLTPEREKQLLQQLGRI